MFVDDPLDALAKLGPSIPGDVSVFLLNLRKRFAETAARGRIDSIEDLGAAFARWWQLFSGVRPGLNAVEVIECPRKKHEREIE